MTEETTESTISIEEALHAYGVLQLLKAEVIRMEEQAQEYYEQASEYYNEQKYFKSNYYQQQGDILLERVCALKQIMGED